MKTAEIPYYEIRLYIGSQEGYHGEKFGLRELMKAVRDFQASHKDKVSVRYTACVYQVGDWDEDGWEVAAIDYPRFPKTSDYLRNWFEGLSLYLIDRLKQDRITVCDPFWSITYERGGK